VVPAVFAAGVPGARFDEALSIVSGRHVMPGGHAQAFAGDSMKGTELPKRDLAVDGK